MSIKRIALLALAACSSAASSAPDLGISCGVTVVDAQTGIDVLLWRPQQSGQAVYVHEVTADWYGTRVTVKVDRSISWYLDPPAAWRWTSRCRHRRMATACRKAARCCPGTDSAR